MWRQCAWFSRSFGAAVRWFLGAAALSLVAAQAAEPGASDWSASATSSARLVSAGGLAGEAYRAGVEIRLEGAGLTYWRHPGDAGVPPVFSFEGSRNLASVAVRYPAPARFEEGGVDAFGYKGEVIFPLDVTPLDRAKPVTLALKLQYAACDRICIPAEATARITLAPADMAGPQAARIASYVAREPKPVAPGAMFKVTARPGDKPAWDITVGASPDARADLFAEAPDGWYFDTRPASGGFTLELAQRPANAENTVEVTLTHVTPAGAHETRLRLDVGVAKP